MSIKEANKIPYVITLLVYNYKKNILAASSYTVSRNSNCRACSNKTLLLVFNNDSIIADCMLAVLYYKFESTNYVY